MTFEIQLNVVSSDIIIPSPVIIQIDLRRKYMCIYSEVKQDYSEQSNADIYIRIDKSVHTDNVYIHFHLRFAFTCKP